MKNRSILTLGALVMLSANLEAVEALQDVEAFYSGGFNQEETGFCFQPLTNFTVRQLGFRFNALTEPSAYLVKLVNAEGAVLASTTVNAAPAPSSQMLYSNIPPVLLTSGSTNYLLCYDASLFAANGTKLWDGQLIFADDPESGSFSVASQVNYLGACLSTNLVDPTNAANFLFVGPNFEFTTEPVVVPSYLRILLTTSNTVQVLWPASDTQGQLQSATNLVSAMTDVTNAPVVVDTNKVVELPLDFTEAYFRLRY